MMNGDEMPTHATAQDLTLIRRARAKLKSDFSWRRCSVCKHRLKMYAPAGTPERRRMVVFHDKDLLARAPTCRNRTTALQSGLPWRDTVRIPVPFLVLPASQTAFRLNSSQGQRGARIAPDGHSW